jgi:hypothetical protein
MPPSEPEISKPFLFQLSHVHPAEVLFAKDKLLDGFILPPVALAPSLNTRPAAKTAIPLA